MARSNRSLKHIRVSLHLILFATFLLVLWLAGGASRSDVAGQILVRCAAWAAIAVALFFQKDAQSWIKAPWLLLCGAVVIAILQLVPLPPAIWQALPGRNIFAQLGESAVWRPTSMVPSATINALGSLVVPAAILVLMSGLSEEEKRWLPTLLMVLVGLSLLLGLLQFSGSGFDNPLINETPGEVSGPFANRNHFALFLANACMLASIWAFVDRGWLRWSAPTAIGFALLSLLMILATGSRAGLMLGGLALVITFLLVSRDLQRALRHHSRWFPVVIAGLIAVAVLFLLLSISADRAVSLDRLLAVDTGQDMRTRGISTVFAAVKAYFPWGAGLGSFDPIFRLQEPTSLLKPTYFNHAHNDFLEIALDAGIFGLSILFVGLAWWLWASLLAWRSGNRLSKLGSAIIFLTIAASLVDYPIRTPLMLAITTIAAVWLSGRQVPDSRR